MVLARMFRRKPFEREGYLLYGAAVAAARQPLFYLDYAAPDTMAGRFDLVSLHVALLIRRIRLDPDPAAKDLAQAVFDAMFNDMDVNLREMGVGDLGVGARVKKLWEAFHGRARAYEAALAPDAAPTALEDALLRNLFGGHPPADARVIPALAAHARALAALLEGQEMAALRRGEARLPPPAPLPAEQAVEP